MNVFNDVVAYLRQVRDVYGDVVWTLRPHAADTAVVDALSQARITTAPIARVPETPHEQVTPEQERGNLQQDDDKWTATETLPELQSAICGCLKCPLGATRNSFVFGSGNPNAQVMVIGEAPGADEDEQGLPFVGRAGQLLTKILESVSLSRDEVYICNIIKCRPPNNRRPTTIETETCEPYLWKQIDIIRPRFILALGLTAANTLLKNKESMTALRGRTHDYHGIPTIVTYHPAALLRNPNWKRPTWEDMQFLRSLIDSANT